MDSLVSLEDVASIVTFLAPGYFAMQIYRLMYGKRARNFSQLAVESIVYSLPIITITNVIWEQMLNRPPVAMLNTQYALLLMATAVAAGIAVTYLRLQWPAKQLARWLGFGSPDDDFVKLQFARLDPKQGAVTVTLKNGDVFSGTPDRTTRYAHGSLKYYSFTNLAWYNPQTNRWRESAGMVIVERAEIQYIQTTPLKEEL